MADLIGTQIGNYRLLRLLGRGGTSDVYLAEHILLKRSVAVKILHIYLPEDGFKAFLSEARTIVGLEHPHIIRILDFGVMGERTPYLVMDYAPNGSLRQRYPKGTRVPLTTVIDYVKPIANALQYMHEQRLLHLDVEPENMFIGANNEILLSEPDIAFVSLSMRTETVSREVTGNPFYMAPEQFKGKPNPASDQYALGIMVYEWLSGDPPFEGNPVQILYQHLYETPHPLREIVPIISSSVETAVMRALAKDPAGRFPSVRKFADALERGAVAPEKRYSTSPSYSSPYPQQYGTLPASESSSYGGQQHGQQTIPASRESSQTPLPTANMPLIPPTALLPPPGTQVLSRVMVDDKTLSKNVSRRTILVGGLVGLLGLAGAEMIASSNLLQKRYPIPPGLIYSYPNIIASVNAVSWYSGGWLLSKIDRIASASDDQKVLLWDATTGNNLVAYTEHHTPVVAVAWSTDGTLVASAGTDDQVRVWHAATQLTIRTYAEGISPFTPDFALAWSPKGLYIAFGGDSGIVQIQNPMTGEVYPKWDGPARTPLDFKPLKAVAWSPDGQQIVAGWDDGTIKVRDAFSEQNEHDVTKYNGSVFSLAWSPIDGSKSIAVAVSDQGKRNSVELWDIATRKLGISYQGHAGIIRCIAWSPDGQYIASAGDDRTVHIWNVDTGVLLYKYSQHTAPVTSVAWAGDSKRVVSGSKDKSVQVWEAV